MLAKQALLLDEGASLGSSGGFSAAASRTSEVAKTGTINELLHNVLETFSSFFAGSSTTQKLVLRRTGLSRTRPYVKILTGFSPTDPNPFLSTPRKFGERGEDYVKTPEPEPKREEQTPDEKPPLDYLQPDPRGLVVDERKGAKTFGHTYTHKFPEHDPTPAEDNGMNDDYRNEESQELENLHGKNGDENNSNPPGSPSAFDGLPDASAPRGDGSSGTGDDSESSGATNGTDGYSSHRFRSQDSLTHGRNRGWFWLPNGPVDEYGQVENPFHEKNLFRPYPKPKFALSKAGTTGMSNSEKAANFAGYASGGIYIAGENGNDLFPNAGNGDEGASEVEPPPPQDPADALFDDPDEKAFGVSKPLTLDRDPTAPKADPPGEPCTFENRCNAAKEA